MVKKRYNSRGRSNPTIEIDNSSSKKVKVDIVHKKDDFDESNAFVLPSEKRKTKIVNKKESSVRLLSKKRRKELEKVLEKKQKKLRRAALLDDLMKVQASADELKQYTSITEIQTKGLKRLFQESQNPESKKKVKKYDDDDATDDVVNSIKGSGKQRLAILEEEKMKNNINDPNVVGFEESSESDMETTDDDIGDNEDITEKQISQNTGPSIEQDKEQEKNSIITTDKPVDVEKKSNKLRRQIVITDEDRKPAVFVLVNRKPEIQEARLKLPVLAEEQSIVEAINENSIVIITGETGSGKTTQVPQFLYEAGYAKDKMIGITEPRRVAAMSMSKRVAEEMNLSANEVSYLIRFEGNATPDTKIKFMTDGVLLKEIQSDFLLTKYSVIILDEAHERSVYTDILIGLLSRIVPLRIKKKNPLKLIIMSATLRVDDFIDNPRLFKTQPPVIKVDSRQFPVTIHFNKRTSENYVLDSIKKAVKIHTRLPDGGILIFLTGQHEVNTVVQKLRKRFPYRKAQWMKVSDKSKSQDNKKEVKKNKEVKKSKEEKDDERDEEDEEELNARNAIRRLKNKKKLQEIQLPNIDLDIYSAVPMDDTQQDLLKAGENDPNDEELLDENEDDDEDILEIEGSSTSQPMWVLPLYSLLPAHKQAKVFEEVPEGCRLCVVSTNVAETSLTIPDIKYVIDSGRCKTRLYDKFTGVSTYRVTYTSQASANQRAGRAGRTGPGHCYRLYSSAVFNDEFEKFSEPEIRRKPVDDLLLQMKVMNIHKVVNFPFPTPPDIIQLKSAEKRLCILGALEQPSVQDQETFNAKVTPLGYSISAFPVAPRFGKMLTLSHQYNLINYTICMVSALSVQEVLIENLGSEGEALKKWLQIRKSWAGVGNSLLLGDVMVLIRAVGAAEYAGSKGKILKFCEENGLRHKAIVEIRKLRQQLANEIALNIPKLDLSIDPNMSPPTDTETRLLRQIILAGMADQVAKKIDPDEIKEDQDKVKWKHAYRALEMEDPVFMHSSCVLRHTSPEWVVYQEIYETNKMYMRGITAIEPEWLPKFSPSLCTMSEPVDDPPPRYDRELDKVFCHMRGTFGRGGWELPLMELEFPANSDGIRWFARFFLEGEVCPKLKRFVPSLLSTTSSINKSWAKLVPRTETIVKTLLMKEVMSKEKLLEIWQVDKKFLLNAYQKWLPESAHNDVALLWPPV
ncbi:probable ATP-dependent RNA helicase kurz isoform X2 [Chelonus insularis]|uniref:probable ATP-dependent RNA helicase kurz isoform X2 n=1 Tax=Chelonus insularis TaxID=460826 RepID=UPI0015882B61|nr:probable ATP-dependent RNA helicase kurz isoform X2 [Chelonus insularis]